MTRWKTLAILTICIVVMGIFGLALYVYSKPRELQRKVLGTTLTQQGDMPTIDLSAFPYGQIRWVYKVTSSERARLAERCLDPKNFRGWRANVLRGYQSKGMCLLVQQPIADKSTVTVMLGGEGLVILDSSGSYPKI